MPEKNHISYLDSLRGLAALTVISEHYVIAYGLPCQNELCRRILDFTPLNFWWDGSAAVSMFFVLSGLVLSLKYFRSGKTPCLNDFDLLGFTIARIFRIWLPYIVVLTISAALYLATAQNPIQQTLLSPSDWLTGMWGNYHLTVTEILKESFLLNLPANIVLLPQAWTLTIELLMSLLLPLGLLLIRKSDLWLIFFTLFSALFLNISVFLVHFALGLLIARYHTLTSVYFAKKYLQRNALLLLGISLYTSGSVWQTLKMNESIMWLCTGLGAGLIIIYILASGIAQKILSNPLLRQIGKVSYSAYLIHMLILLCITPNILKMLEEFTNYFFAMWFGGYVMTILTVQLLSFASYSILEAPSVALGHKIKALIKTTS